LGDRLDALGRTDITVDTDYQLSVEHAELAAGHDVVVFVDAATDVEATSQFYLRPVRPSADASYSSHAITPPAVLQLAAQFFGATPRGWLLGIRPGDIDSFAEGLTPEGETNLEAALAALLAALESNRLIQ
jgi:hydrogenase maturation protease